MEEILKRLYENAPDEQQIINEHNEVMLTIQMDLNYGQGVLKYHKGAAYPEKGLTEPKAMFAANLAKKLLVHTVRLSINPLLIFKKHPLESTLATYNEIAYRSAMQPYIIHTHFMPPVARNLRIFITKFLTSLNITPIVVNQFAAILSSIITLDDAYKYRMQDIASECNSINLQRNPRKELLRLLSIYKQRDHEVVSKKIMTIRPIISMALLIPKYKKAFIDALTHINIEEMGLDEADKYWVCQRKGYKFLGKTEEEREKLLEGVALPKLMKRENYVRLNTKKVVQIHKKRNKRH